MYKKRLGEFKVVITGGEAALLKEFFKDKDYIFDDELLIKGLKIIYEKNK